MKDIDHLLEEYKWRFGLQSADLERVDHEDTLVALVYKVRFPTGTSSILKICPREEDYRREQFFLKQLEAQLPVPHIVQEVEPEEGLSGALLMECLPGALLQEGDWTEALAHEVGSNLARLHLNRTKGYGDLTDPGGLTSDPCVYFGQKFEEELEECRGHLPSNLVQKCQRFYEAHVPLLDSVDGPCMIHRDFRPGNLMVCDGRLQGIIDWAGGRSGFAEQDFCSIEHRSWPKRSAHKQSLLVGYASVRPLPDYGRIMPLLRLGRALAVVGFTVQSGTWQGKNARIYQFNRDFLNSV